MNAAMEFPLPQPVLPSLARELCLIIEAADVTRHVTGNRQTIDIARGIAGRVISAHCPES